MLINATNLEELLNEVSKLVSDPHNSIPTESNHDDNSIESTINISKVWYLDKGKGDNGTIVNNFKVIAPFLDKDSVKATIKVIGEKDWLFLTYKNDKSYFSDNVTCNFKLNEAVEFKYCFGPHKVDKKKMKLTYDNGILTVHTVTLPTKQKNEDFSIGL